MTADQVEAPGRIGPHDEDVAAWRFVTARLLIRPIELADAETLVAIRAASPFVPRRRSAAEIGEIIAPMIGATPGSAPGWHQFAIVHLADGLMVGDIGVNFAAPQPEQAEIGYGIHADWRRRGFAYEAIGRMLNHLLGDHGLHRVVAITDRRNTASRQLLESLRFRLEARYVQSYKLDGHWTDERGYARLAGE